MGKPRGPGPDVQVCVRSRIVCFPEEAGPMGWASCCHVRQGQPPLPPELPRVLRAPSFAALVDLSEQRVSSSVVKDCRVVLSCRVVMLMACLLQAVCAFINRSALAVHATISTRYMIGVMGSTVRFSTCAS